MKYIQIILAIFFSAIVQTNAQSYHIAPGKLQVDGSVEAMQTIGNNLLIAGNFRYTGQGVDGNVFVDDTLGSLISSKLHFTSTNVNSVHIDAVISDNQNGFFIGGSFDFLNGVGVYNLVHLDSNLQIVPDNYNVPEVVTCLCLFQGKLYIGTGNDNSGLNTFNLVRMNLTTGHLDNWAIDVGQGTPMEVLKSDGDHLFCSGQFQYVTDDATSITYQRENIFVLDSNGIVSNFNLPIHALSPYVTPVNAIQFLGDTIIVCGNFDSIGNY